MRKELDVPFFIYTAGGTNETHRHDNVGWESTGEIIAPQNEFERYIAKPKVQLCLLSLTRFLEVQVILHSLQNTSTASQRYSR